MICAHNYVCTFDFIPRIWSRPHNKDCRYILSSSKNSLSQILTYRDSTPSFYFDLQKQLELASKTHLNTRNMGAYRFCNLFLTCPAFSVRLVPNSNTASEILSNSERDKQLTREKTRYPKNTLLYFGILIHHTKYLINIHFIVYRTLLIFSPFL